MCCGDTQTADDIAQDALVKAYMSSDELRDEANFKAWIFRIAYNTFVSYRRSVKPTSDIEEAYTSSADDTADSTFRYQDLYMALNQLSEKERSATLLYYMQGYSTAETAEILEISPEAARQLLSRARIHLRKLLPH